MSTNSSSLISDIQAAFTHNSNVDRDSVRIPISNRMELKYDYSPYEITVTNFSKGAVELMDFGSAVRAMKKGLKVSRSMWGNIARNWVCIPLLDGPKVIPAQGIWGKPNAEYAESHGGTVKVIPYLTKMSAAGEIQMGWLPSFEDIVAEDWVVV